MNGHWFCLRCDDVVNLSPPGRWDRKRGAFCPVCQRPLADWIPDKPDEISMERGTELFKELRETLNIGNHDKHGL